jgi:glycosyltransferase involved in cell wall biosynthesis
MFIGIDWLITSMKILLISQYFWPESFIINELVKCLVAEGHTLEVLTGKPNYPDGKIHEGFSARGCTTEYFNDCVVVHRVPIIPRGKGGVRRLLLNYFSFVFSGLFYFYRKVKSKKFDVILVFTLSPITSAIPGIYLKKRLKLPLALWIQDLWPESLSATGYVQNRFLLNLVKRLVSFIYTSSDILLVQSQAFKKPVSTYVAIDKIIYYPNSYLDVIHSEGERPIASDLLSELESNCCFVFAGNIGAAQSLETIIEAATRIRHLKNCKIVLVGSGSMSSWVEEQKSKRDLNNLVLAGRYPASVMPQIFAKAAGLLVTLKREEIFSYTIPSKVQAYLAAARPVLAALDGEGARIIAEANAGLTGPAEDATTLAENIEQIYNMSDLERDKLGQSGRAYFLKHFEMVSQSKRLIEILQEKISKQEITLK